MLNRKNILPEEVCRLEREAIKTRRAKTLATMTRDLIALAESHADQKIKTRLVCGALMNMRGSFVPMLSAKEAGRMISDALLGPGVEYTGAA